MKLTLLGTAAAEGWPAPFCACEACEKARQLGGKNIRTRSGALLDEDCKIDWSADSLTQVQRWGKSLAGLRALIFTHQHSDHICAQELAWLQPPFTNTPPGTLHVYGNQQVLDWFPVPEALGLELHLFEPFQAVKTVTGDEILPLPTDHCPEALVLRITRGGKTLFYGHDSGLYPEETLEALAGGPELDIVLFDCTNGGVNCGNRGHMDISGNVLMLKALRERGLIHDGTRAVSTHFSHNGKLLHEELVAECGKCGLEVGFDGMVVEV